MAYDSLAPRGGGGRRWVRGNGMTVFRDETGRRGKAVRLAGILGVSVALASGGIFLASVFPAPWTRRALVEEPAPPPRTGAAPAAVSKRALEHAREARFKAESGRLAQLLAQAEEKQRRRTPQPAQPVLAAFYVNWDAQSLASLEAHRDRLTHVMPEWIRIRADGQLVVDEDHRIDGLVRQLQVMPTVSNYGERGFSGELARRILATDGARKEAAQRLLEACRSHGWAGLNLDLESLSREQWRQLTLLVRTAAPLFHREGLQLTVDVPGDDAGVPVEELAADADFLVVMAYDEHASSDDPGPIATPDGVLASAAAYLRRAPADKLVVALGAYGYDWPLDADGDAARAAEEVSFAQALALARENDAATAWDAQARTSWFDYQDDETHEHHVVHFLDAPAAFAQLRAIAGMHLRGTAVWRLGAEDPDLFALFTGPPGAPSFDAGAAHLERDGLIANSADDVMLVGDGELISLNSAPQVGRRRLTLDPTGDLARVEYAQYPSGWILDRRGGKPRGRVLLTFDDGPDPVWTPRILDALGQVGAHGVFFVIGQSAERHPDLVRREIQEGHVVGNHSYTHPDLSRASPLRIELELNATERLLEWLTSARPRLFRPPYHSDESLEDAPHAAVIAHASKSGFLVLGQDIDPEDFARRDPQAIASQVLSRARSGSVVLLHDGGGDRSATVAALPLIAAGLRAQGLSFAEPSDVTGLSRAELLPPAPADVIVSRANSLVFAVTSGIARFLAVAFGVAIGLLALRAVILATAAPLQVRRSRRRRAAGGALPAPGTVSVVVPAYDEEAVITRTVDSLLAQEPPVLEVICVDDGSTDRTLAVLHERYDGDPRVRILGKPNGGKSSALNLGFAKARGELVVALDSDTLFTATTVRELCAPFADPRVAAVAGNAKVGNRVNRLTRWQALEYVTAQNLERRAWDLAGAVPVVPGAVGAWRRAVVTDAGGFHEDTLAEDTDLTLRLIAGGHRVAYAEDALGYTEAPERAGALLKQRFRWTFGVLQACWKHKSRLFRRGGGVIGWAILPAFVVYQFAVPLVAPAVDLFLLVSLVHGDAAATLGYYVLFFAIDLALSAVAVLLEGEDLRLLLGLFAQRVAYRQLLWVALAKALWNAFAGLAVGWGKLARTGTATAGPTTGHDGTS